MESVRCSVPVPSIFSAELFRALCASEECSPAVSFGCKLRVPMPRLQTTSQGRMLQPYGGLPAYEDPRESLNRTMVPTTRYPHF